ncbi:MAG TPA: hypothetical protein VFN85_08660 [Solirubrobacterales bacterium]|nr:hypothetical protein [Solirubrobacterales bacterium]
MRDRAAPAAFAFCLCLILSLAAVPAALADTGDIIAPSDLTHPSAGSGWQAGTCKDEPAGEPCSIATPDLFFETASAHPNFGFTQFIIKNEPPGETPVGELKTVRVDLPVGFSVNPGATPRCPLSTFEAGASGCPPESVVGKSEATVSLPPFGTPAPPTAPTTEVPVYNVEPKPGEAARFGLELAGNEVFLEGDVAWSSDYHEGFTIHVPAALPEALGGLFGLLGGEKGLILKNRLVFEGRAGDGTFLTTPTTCFGPAYKDDWKPGELPGGPSGHVYSTLLRADSVGKPDPNFPAGSSYFESPIPPLSETSGPGTSPKGCSTIPYEPALEVQPGTANVNSPAAAEVDVEVPHLKDENGQDSSHTRSATVTLPQGMGLNPSAAAGLETCTEDEFGKGTRNPVACPPESVIGHARIESPPLVDQADPQPEEVLEGDVYAGKQESRDPASGKEYRIFIEAKSDRYGISVRLIGDVRANPVTGQLTTTIAETPQVPFTAFDLSFRGGARAVLSSPPTCGPNKGTAVMTPWSGNPPATPGSSFALSNNPDGGACPKTMSERPFTPGFAAGPASSRAGAFSPVSIQIARPDGQQELKGADVVLPPGMSGRLRGIPYCPEGALAAAAGKAGAEEIAASSCPAASQVGTASVAVGTGPSPYKIDGKVFLSGPYHGAPLSLAVVTPATAGPYDLGTVVVRVALFVDPETAQVHAVSDPVPDVFGGAQLSIRSIDLKMDKPDFTLNPTSCEPFATTGTLAGGGGDPTNPAAFSAFGVNAPFQATDCNALGFKPKLFTKLIGGRRAMRRNGHPAFRAVLVAREGDANIKRAALTLPHSQFLDQGHIGTICTRVQLAASACPARSIYGYARASSPLLDEEVAGPVYLVSSEHELPDLLADLHGQVNVRLRGVISAAKARMRTVFYPVPDVPVSKFTLNMKGGKKGLLVNSRDLCKRPNRSFLNFKAQNGKRLKVKKLPLRTPGCRRARKHRHGHRR